MTLAGHKRPRERSSSVSSVPAAGESPFRQVRVHCTMVLVPAYLGSEHLGVSELLNARLLRYDPRLGGVLLAYSSLRLEQGFGRFSEDLPEISMAVSFKATLFVAPKGMRMEGVVTQVTAGHVMLLVCGAFQVSVSADKIHPRYKFSSSLGHFVAETSSLEPSTDVLQVGMPALFEVVTIHDKGGAWHIEGSMLHEALGPLVARRRSSSVFSSQSNGKSSSSKSKKAKREKKRRKETRS